MSTWNDTRKQESGERRMRAGMKMRMNEIANDVNSQLLILSRVVGHES